jgi:hypothetical protein
MIKCMKFENTDKCSAQSNSIHWLTRIKKRKAKWNSDFDQILWKNVESKFFLLSLLLDKVLLIFIQKHVVQCAIEDALNEPLID